MERFLIAYSDTLKFEGKYSNDPKDRGGETYMGISRKFHPEWKGWGIIDLIKDPRGFENMELNILVTRFYYEQFWVPLNCEKFDQPISMELFDIAVNQGKNTAAKYLQDSLNMLNNNQRFYKNIQVDGILGEQTIKTYRSYMKTSNFPGRSQQRNIKILLKAMNGLQFERYKNIIMNDESQELYFYGWINRI